MNIKKKIMVIFATGIMAFSASPFVLAATPAPANNTQQAEQVDTTQQDTANQNNTANQNTQGQDRKSTRLNSSHIQKSRMPSSA